MSVTPPKIDKANNLMQASFLLLFRAQQDMIRSHCLIVHSQLLRYQDEIKKLRSQA